MKRQRFAYALSVLALLSGCGGGGGGSNGTSVISSGPTPSATPTPSPSPTPASCSLRSRQDWALATLQEWYLFPETLPTNVNPASFSTVGDYIDALTATARSQNRDRFFTFLASIADENAFLNSGSSAGFGVRLTLDQSGTRLFVAEAFEGAPALAAGIDRGTEILAIGTTSSNLQTVASLAAIGGNAINDALGPSTAGTTRFLQIRDGAGTRTISVTKSDFSLTPVSSRYGAQIINDGGRQVGYLNLRTFISTADPALRTAFANFRAQGITNIIVDLRYNGGGLVSTAELLGDLLGANRTSSEVFSFTAFRPEKSSNNSTKFFSAQSQSIAPTRIAFIGTRGTASASELTINAITPYLHSNSALIGTNTFGKPVGQIAIDRAACDDRLRVVAFATQNASRQGDYYNGLAGFVEASCQASDDLARPLGDPMEASTRQALNFLAGQSCTAIAGSGQTSQSLSTARRTLLTPDHPAPAQREVPGLY